jgi:hypothetical protein
MPAFDTHESVNVTIELGVAYLRIIASDRTDTVVEVRPTDESDPSDVEAAAQVRVDYAGGTLELTGPRRAFDFSRKSRSVDVAIELPTGSNVAAHLLMGDVQATGRLGECRIKTTGHIRLDRTGALNVRTGAGRINADTVAGDADLSTGTGRIEIGAIAGAAVVKNSNGDTTLESVGGDVRIRNANGDIGVNHAGAGVDAKTSNGDIRLGEVVRGAVTLGTAAGGVDVGIATGTAAWLEVNTGFGKVRNELNDALRPDAADATVEVRARTSYGDITIHRA